MILADKFLSRDSVLQFLRFAMISGVGWILDVCSYYLLYKYFFMSPAWANVISSFLAITFVWFTSVSRVFGFSGVGKVAGVFYYWIYQSISILLYSFILLFVYHQMVDQSVFTVLKIHAEIGAKVFVTPFNLATNFIFMKYLMSHLDFLIKHHDR